MVAWNNYKKALFAKMPSLKDTLNRGATLDELRAAEEETGINFPTELKALYLDNNGDDGEALCGMMLGFHFLDLSELRAEWRSWKDIADDPTHNDGARFTSKPEGCIKKCYADTKWIPICSDSGGNFIGLDLDPDVSGCPGQIINFGRDEDAKFVIAENLGQFIERLTRIVNSPDFYIGEYDGEDVIFLGTDSEEGAHLTDYLRGEDSVK